MITSPIPSSYVCDTLPAARLASGASDPDFLPERSPSPPSKFEVTETLDTEISMVQIDEIASARDGDDVPSQPPARKLCVRHQRMADEGTNLKLQQVSL